MENGKNIFYFSTAGHLQICQNQFVSNKTLNMWVLQLLVSSWGMNFETNLNIQTSFVIQQPLHVPEGNKIRCSWYERPCYMHSLCLHEIYQFAPWTWNTSISRSYTISLALQCVVLDFLHLQQECLFCYNLCIWGLHVCRQTLKLKNKKSYASLSQWWRAVCKNRLLHTTYWQSFAEKTSAYTMAARVALLSPCKDSTVPFSLGKDHVITDEFNAKVW